MKKNNETKKNLYGGSMKKIAILVLAIFMASLCYGQNLVTNGDLELWTGGVPDDWDHVENITQESTIVHGGTYSAKHESASSTKDFGHAYIAGIISGNDYTLSYYYLDNDDHARTRLWSKWKDASGSTVGSTIEGSYSTDNSSWQHYTNTITAPAGATQFYLEVRVYKDASGDYGGYVYYDDFSLTDDGVATPSIEKAYAISSTALDVFYNLDVASVDPADFELTGSQIITFSTATIDGSNAKLVHLSGASTPMADDNTLDTISDGAKSTYDFYAGITSIAYTNAANPGGTIDGSHFATFTGIISANDGHNNVWISDAGGQFNGVLIYDYDFDGLVSVGDEILFRAYRDVYNNLSELKDPELINTISTGNSPYGPSVIPGSNINKTYGADNPTAEPWEGQLVVIEDVEVAAIVKDDLYIGSNDDWTTTFVIGDAVDYGYSLTGALLDSAVASGNLYDIVGVVDWSTYNPYYRINPRDAYDIISTISVDPTPGNEFVIQNHPNPFTGSTTISFSLPHNATGEINIYNIHGQLVKTLIPEDQSATWNGLDDNDRVVANGIYFYTLDTGKEIVTKKMILMK